MMLTMLRELLRMPGLRLQESCSWLRLSEDND